MIDLRLILYIITIILAIYLLKISIHAITSYRKNKKLLNYIKSKTSLTNNKIPYTIQSNDFWGYIYLINDSTGDLYCIRHSFNVLEKLERKTFTNTAEEVVKNINIQEITKYYYPDIVNYLGLLQERPFMDTKKYLNHMK